MRKLEYTFKTDTLFKMLFVHSTLPRTIVISIIDFILFECEEYDSFFQPLEVKRHTLLSDKMEVPVMSQAINAYYTITASSGFREKERLCAKARHDEAQALHNAERNAKIGIAQKLLKRNRPVDEIVEDTGLTREEVEDLRIKS